MILKLVLNLWRNKETDTRYHRAHPCEKIGPKNQWFKPVISENKSLVRKKLITSFEKLTSGFWDLAKFS